MVDIVMIEMVDILMIEMVDICRDRNGRHFNDFDRNGRHCQ